MNQRLLDFAEPPDRAGVEARIDEILAGSDDELTWSIRPQLYHLAGAPNIRRRHFAAVSRHLVSTAMLRRGLPISNVGQVSFLMDTQNHRLVLTPIAQALADATGGRLLPAPNLTGRPEALLRTGKALATIRSIVNRAREAELEVSGSQLAELTLGVARAIERARAQLVGQRALVVSNQHQPHIRAYLWAARELGVPSLYVPHAPLVRTRDYSDLPVDAAGLRGEREVSLYRDAGAVGEMAAVGNPAVAPIAMAATNETGPIVFAPSPIARDRLRRLVSLITSAIDEPVVVAPHPRSDLRLLKGIVPGHWVFIPPGQSTFEFLRGGARALLQSTSGVAWEALYLGVHTIELRPDGGEPSIMFMSEGDVPVVTSAAELRTAIVPSSTRHERRRLAAQWCDPLGAAAVSRILDLIATVTDNGPSERLLLDGWRKG